MTPVTVVFDLDGTLVDTGPDIAAALNHSLGLLGYPPFELDDVAKLVGHGARALIERGLQRQGLAASSTDAKTLLDKALPAFMRYYAANICVGSQPYPGIVGVLDRLAARGVRIGVCTNKPHALSTGLFAALGWTQRFHAVLGGDSLPVRKPDPLHLLETIAQAGGDRARAVMVGDSTVDVDAARAAGVPVIAVAFGFSETPATDFGADAVIEHYDDFDAAFERLIG